jgi:short-subunit dehydrogenase
LRAFLPSLIAAKHGHVVTMSSLLGRAACAQAADYNASKAALVLLHETLRQELDYHYDAPRVRTTIVYPGLILTPMMSGQRPMSEAALIPRWLFDFVLPSLPPEAVAKEIAKALDAQESRDIMIPAAVKGSLLIPIIPYWMNYMSKWVRISCRYFRIFTHKWI